MNEIAIIPNKKKCFDYRHLICIAITLAFLACTVFRFFGAIGRVIEGGRDFGLSVGYYFCELFAIPHNITPTVNDLPKIPFFDIGGVGSMEPSTSLPDNWSGFKSDWALYWRLILSADNLAAYANYLGKIIYIICQVLLIAIPLIFAVYLLLKRYLTNENNDYNIDSGVLKVFKRVVGYTYIPVKRWLAGFLTFIKIHKGYWSVWLIIWALNFNLFAVVLEFLAFYFYFVISFDVVNLYQQVYKLFLDLSVPFTAIPVWLWVIAGLYLFDRFRKSIGYSRLYHYENRNRGLINERPLVFMLCGSMGKLKTTILTDMALSQEVMFRDKAFEKILENDLKFPFFPWCNLENDLRCAMENHDIYNLASCRLYIRRRAEQWAEAPTSALLYYYDYERYGLTYNDELKNIGIWDVIETYAQLYFIYVIQSSLLISNYSVRVDGMLSDIGNFPLWNADFFKRDSRLIDSYSRHAHIIDFDSLRLGKKMLENNINANNFEFGVVLITEVGKERGNNLELIEKKKKDDEANQKNDNFNGWLKMVRHSATVDNFPFVRVITDEQRAASWGADARDLCDIVHIVDKGEINITMPFFTLGELLHDWLFSKFSNLYYRYRYVRSDNTLPMYLLKSITAKIEGYYTRIYNRFGYRVMHLQVENGTQDGHLADKHYYVMSKKIYSKRFSTDCFSDFFTAKALRSPIGINDMFEYGSEKATLSELYVQNSYFMRDLLQSMATEEKSEKSDKAESRCKSRGERRAD